MNAIVVQPPASVIAPHEAALLVLADYLAPARELHLARDLLKSAWADRPYLPSPEYVRESVLSGSPASAKWLELIRSDIATVPPHDELKRLALVLKRAAFDQVERPVAIVLVGLMLDGFRSRPTESTPTYIGAAVELIMDQTDEYGDPSPDRTTSNAALAWAIRRLWRTCTFPPSLTELLDACRLSEQRFRSALRAVGSLADRRLEAEELLAIASETGATGQ